MTVKEFVDSYNMHDSYITKVNNKEGGKTVVLRISLALWLQETYVEGEQEEALIEVTFQNVHQFICDGGDPAGPFVGILETTFENGYIVFTLLDDATGDCFDLRINAERVDVMTVTGE